mmetsp:Transcript_66541/g.205971  ORF Transcript_66541/g.205971 Transcript_66541/m.205971 type:complete len:691 (+) Transcript_66541:67-2139(+)|eukprot:CAMPEP_0204603682 /NCGR_PEP_ID=MMETSP0661-20131031/57406_1 /ASSEMBLY_ACC=CAM_ASM_000606 /TAXON_ID=109239 /ORGANISM="Alexandrium margalefi, Strain AMGDE01CS-322" /LENGTH=690 /DNA_ID=CAMNT_0051614769 /DNA_START=66 /DNA_END=2138 /DNA_ORIENTATION=+
MTDAEKEEQLVSWLSDQSLGRHTDKLMDMNGEVGLQSLDDLLELSDEDVQGIGEKVNMNMIERKRFLKAVQALKAPKEESPKAALQVRAEEPQAVEQAMDPAQIDTAIAKEAHSNDQYEVVRAGVEIRNAPNGDAPSVGTLGEGRILHAIKARVLDNNNHVWAELTALELQRSGEPGTQASRGFVLIDGKGIGQGLQLRGPISGEGGVKMPEPQDEAIDAADLQASLQAFTDVPSSTDLFEVVGSSVDVTKGPSRDAPFLGTLRKGRVFHVKKEPVIGSDGRTYAELTNLELWRSFEPDDANDRAFALVDGTDLGKGLLLRGPIPHDANRWLASRNQLGQRITTSATATAPKKVLPFDNLQTYAHLYEVTFSMAFVKTSPDPKSKTVGCLKKGTIFQAFNFTSNDAEGHAWAELTHYELWHSCKPTSVDDRGFVLINAEHLKEVGAPLLRGPLSPDEQRRYQERLAGEVNGLRAQKHAERLERTRDAEQFERQMKEGHWDESAVLYRFRALRCKVLMKWSEDPRYEWITTSACKPGTTFYSTGMEWRGPNGERWIDGCTVNNKPRWLLAEDPSVVGGPYLVEKMYTEKHMLVSMNYLTVRGVEPFETLIDRDAKVKALKERFCKEVNLMTDIVSLKAKFTPTAPTLTTLNDKASLTDSGISESTQLFLEYTDDVYQAMMVGRTMGWLVKD